MKSDVLTLLPAYRYVEPPELIVLLHRNKTARGDTYIYVFAVDKTGIQKVVERYGVDLYYHIGVPTPEKLRELKKALEGAREGYRRVPRRLRNEDVAALPALFADIDYKDPNAEERLGEVEEVLKELGLYERALIVFSGRGFHVYLPFDRLISKDEWQPVEEKFVNVLRAKGLPADPAVKDPARVLRVVGTINSRSSKEVRVVKDSEGPVDFREVRELLEKVKIEIEKEKKGQARKRGRKGTNAREYVEVNDEETKQALVGAILKILPPQDKIKSLNWVGEDLSRSEVFRSLTAVATFVFGPTQGVYNALKQALHLWLRDEPGRAREIEEKQLKPEFERVKRWFTGSDEQLWLASALKRLFLAWIRLVYDAYYYSERFTVYGSMSDDVYSAFTKVLSELSHVVSRYSALRISMTEKVSAFRGLNKRFDEVEKLEDTAVREALERLVNHGLMFLFSDKEKGYDYYLLPDGSFLIVMETKKNQLKRVATNAALKRGYLFIRSRLRKCFSPETPGLGECEKMTARFLKYLIRSSVLYVSWVLYSAVPRFPKIKADGWPYGEYAIVYEIEHGYSGSRVVYNLFKRKDEGYATTIAVFSYPKLDSNLEATLEKRSNAIILKKVLLPWEVIQYLIGQSDEEIDKLGGLVLNPGCDLLTCLLKYKVSATKKIVDGRINYNLFIFIDKLRGLNHIFGNALLGAATLGRVAKVMAHEGVPVDYKGLEDAFPSLRRRLEEGDVRLDEFSPEEWDTYHDIVDSVNVINKAVNGELEKSDAESNSSDEARPQDKSEGEDEQAVGTGSSCFVRPVVTKYEKVGSRPIREVAMGLVDRVVGDKIKAMTTQEYLLTVRVAEVVLLATGDVAKARTAVEKFLKFRRKGKDVCKSVKMALNAVDVKAEIKKKDPRDPTPMD